MGNAVADHQQVVHGVMVMLMAADRMCHGWIQLKVVVDGVILIPETRIGTPSSETF